MTDDDYVQTDRWAECAPANVFESVDDEDFGLLHRHWIWANHQRTLFDAHLDERERTTFEAGELAEPIWSTVLLWYSLLWAVIEAFNDRRIPIAGPFRDDIDAVGDDLRRCRNAVLHVPRSGDYYDQRILAWIGRSDSVPRVRRINSAFGRLFLEELKRRSDD